MEGVPVGAEMAVTDDRRPDSARLGEARLMVMGTAAVTMTTTSLSGLPLSASSWLTRYRLFWAAEFRRSTTCVTVTMTVF